MSTLNPWRFGSALALTVVLGYAACTVLWVAFTDPAFGFLNSLFHGLDFRRLTTDGGFTIGGAVYAAVERLKSRGNRGLTPAIHSHVRDA